MGRFDYLDRGSLPEGARRAAMLQAANGRTVFVNPQGDALDAENAVPLSVPLALAPGASFWYAFWPTSEGVGARSF